MGPQAYHPLFLWWAVHLEWLCRFIKYAKLKPKFRSFKTKEYEIKTHKIAAMCFDLWFCVYFGDLRLANAMSSK